jgi:hypothetical protein
MHACEIETGCSKAYVAVGAATTHAQLLCGLRRLFGLFRLSQQCCAQHQQSVERAVQAHVHRAASLLAVWLGVSDHVARPELKPVLLLLMLLLLLPCGYQAFGGLPPNPLRPERWRPIVQFHFVAAARPPVPISSTELVVRKKRFCSLLVLSHWVSGLAPSTSTKPCKSNSSTQAAKHAVTPFPCMQGCSLMQGCARKQGWPDPL